MRTLQEMKENGYLKNYDNLITIIYNAKLIYSENRKHVVEFFGDKKAHPIFFYVFKEEKNTFMSEEFRNKKDALKFIKFINNER